MTDVLYDKLVYGRDLTSEQWRKIKYRPFSDSDMYGIIEDPSFGIDKSEIGPIIPTDRILYRVVDGGHKPESEWITENCSDNVFDESTGEGYLVLNEGVTELYVDWDDTMYNIFCDNGYNDIKSVEIPTCITRIEGAFQYCNNLIQINIPDSVLEIGVCTFSYCNNLSSITIPDYVTIIGAGAFEGCSDLTSISIPDSVRKINSYAFRNCRGLTSIIIPDSVTEIGGYAFDGTGWFNSQPDGILYLNNWCLGYKGNKPTGDLIIIEGTKGFAGSAFDHCTGLTSIDIPDSLTLIGDAAFYGCSSLTSINLPDNVTSIGNSTFRYCSELTSINIPNSIIEIGWGVFEGCWSLNSINIPDSITSIGDYAFKDCSELTTVTCQATKPPILGSDNFNISGDTLYVPAGSVEAYTNSDWNTYFSGRIQPIQ